MKKLYQSEKWKRYSEKRSRKNLRRKSKKKRAKGQHSFHPAQYKSSYKYIKRGKDRVEIKAPKEFSLINNPDETLEFFKAIDEKIERKENIYIDLALVENLTTDAILYMLSRMEFRKVSHSTSNISGNVPKSEECNKIFETSGFYKFVYSNKFDMVSDPKVYSITTDTIVWPEKAKEAKVFTLKCLGKKESNDAKKIYEIIIECMTNAKQHAYASSNKFAKWWLMASFQERQSKVCFTFMDNGYGIPKTLRKRMHEPLIELAKKTFRSSIDADLIFSALEGDFLRTKTGERYRGKGLPKIYETFRNDKIVNLKVISRRGYVDCSKGHKKSLRKPFHGTLLSWEFV